MQVNHLVIAGTASIHNVLRRVTICGVWQTKEIMIVVSLVIRFLPIVVKFT